VSFSPVQYKARPVHHVALEQQPEERVSTLGGTTEGTMPGNPKKCRLHARKCRRLAITASDVLASEKFLHLAGTWDSLAAELESTHPLLAAMKDIEYQFDPPKTA
jgi:hypothetical protein